MLSRIEVQRQVPAMFGHRLAVEIEPADRVVCRKLQGDARQLRLERTGVLHGELVAVALIVLRGPRRSVRELVPCGDGLADRLVAEREIEQRAELRSELQALRE